LLAEGLSGMKIWPFDFVAHFPGGWDNWRSFRGMFDPSIRSLGGHDISASDLARALEPFRKIRRAVGDRMEIMVEGHGLWSLPAAQKIASALEEFQPAWRNSGAARPARSWPANTWRRATSTSRSWKSRPRTWS
jgi:L-alanine-DL-glutamate epimerase-like enolase superfamily enzyme